MASSNSTFKIKFTTDIAAHRRAMAEFTAVTQSAFGAVRKVALWGGGLGGLGAGLSLAATAKDMLSLNAAAEQTKIAFETFLGSADKAGKVLADLRQFADVTPYGGDEIIAAGRSLLTVISNTDELIPRLTVSIHAPRVRGDGRIITT